MNRGTAPLLFGVICLTAGAVGATPVSAQTFQDYHCADGTRFIAAFYPHDPRAYLQIDGRAATLKRRFTFSGSRYSGDGVILKMMKAGVTIKRQYRQTTACEPA